MSSASRANHGPGRILLPAALLLTLATGFSGLAYEVAWQKYLAILLGSHSEATAAVLGIFLAGLAVGYEVFGALTRRLVGTDRSQRLLPLYAAAEAGIGLWALAFPWLFAGARKLSLAVPLDSAGTAFAFDVLLTALLVLPPTVLMGGTIPMLTQRLSRGLGDATRVHAWVYGLNTAGAFAGALAAGFWLLPWLGLDRTLAAMAAVNLTAAAVFFGLALRTPAPAGEPAADAAPDERGAASVAGYAAVACLTGFAMMALQTVVIRVAGLSFGASHFTFSMVVAVFVLCIAIGSLAVSLLPRVPRLALLMNQWLLMLLVAALYTRIEEAPYWVHVLRTQFGRAPEEFAAFHRAAFGWLLLALAPAVLLSGAALPLLFHHVRRRAGELGAVAGRLYAWNTFGSLLGALLGGYALLFVLDLHEVYRVALAAIVVSGAVLVVQLYGRSARPTAAVLALGGVAGLALMPPWNPQLLTGGLFRTRGERPVTKLGPMALLDRMPPGMRLVFHEDDPTATVTVTECCEGTRTLRRSLATNGKPDGSTGLDYATMALAGLIPALLSERAERAFVIGWGTGITAGVLASLDDMQEVQVAEISPGVLAAAPLFDFANHGASRSPRIRPIRSDAYRALLRADERFDVIVSEPSNPWVSGVEMLYSHELLEAARDRLAPGGVFLQWYHQYETDRASLELVLRTYASVFEHLAVWYGVGPDIFLLGLRDPAGMDLDRVLARALRPDLAAGLTRSGIEGPAALLAHEIWPLGVVHAMELEGPLHSLTHPLLSDLAARAFFTGRAAELPPAGAGEAGRRGRENSLLGRYLAGLGPEERNAATRALARESCRHRIRPCTVWLGDWQRREPDSEERQRLLATAAPPKGGRVDPVLVDEAAALLADAPSADVGPLRPAVLHHRTRLYHRFQQHALAFEAARLIEMWERCEHATNPAACDDGMRAAETLLDGS